MKPTATRQRGMSLIEIMVGVLIGLIGCVLIFQVYGVAESRKRSVSSGSDMDISGRLGLMTLERDIQLAGFGFGTGASSTAGVGGVLGCTVTAFDNTRAGGRAVTPNTGLNASSPDSMSCDKTVSPTPTCSMVIGPTEVHTSVSATKQSLTVRTNRSWPATCVT